MTARVRQWAHFQHRRPDCDTRACRQILLTQIHLNVELVTGERPTIFLLRDERGDTRVHDVDLHLWMCGAVRSFSTAAHFPVIADQSIRYMKLRFVEHFSSVPTRPSPD